MMIKLLLVKRLMVFLLSIIFNCLITKITTAQQKFYCNDYFLYEENPFVYTSEIESIESNDDDCITIAFWNIEYWPGGMFEKPPKTTSVANQLVAVKHIIDREKPSILITSEIYSFSSARFLNQNLEVPYPYFAVSAYTLDNKDFHSFEKYEDIENQSSPPKIFPGRRHEHALFSNSPFDDIIEIEISESDKDQFQPRGFILAKYTIKNNIVWIYGVHSSAGERWAQYRTKIPMLLLCDMQNRNIDPQKDLIIVCGDFNMDYYNDKESLVFEPLFKAGFSNAHHGVPYPERITKPSSGTHGIVGGGSTIDYIFVSQKLMKRLNHSKIIADSAGGRPLERAGRDPGIASDHRMLKIEIKVK